MFSPLAHAGGTAENVLLIIDPTRPDAQYLGNYYKNARNIPASNILYMDPGATDYPTFVSDNLDAVFGTLANAGIDDHIDFIILAPADSYFINAPGLINDGCSPVNRFAISAAYMTAFISDQILSGRSVSMPNRYFRAAGARYFSSSTSYFDGLPSTDSRARRYFLGATLGYTGLRGNTPDELIAMIDRSVAADGTHPAGTFYFMETTDANRSSPRDGLFDATVTKIINAGGNAEHLMDVLPLQRHDCLGIMTGWASPDIDNGDFTILPGAYCDHLTSFAGTFATSSQVKLSRWIVKGASGSYGTVEEPCNYPGKFPTARIHQFYFKGLALGEAVFRNLEFVAFQGLIYGDPLTRPFAYPPDVQVAAAPTGTVSGTVQFTPSATSSNPNGVSFTGFDLHVDGRVRDSIADGDAFSLDTTKLPDGWHDLRVVTSEDTSVHSAGRWTAGFVSDNRGRSATLTVSPGSGDWSTAFTADLAAFGTGAAEVRLVQNGRVVAAAS